MKLQEEEKIALRFNEKVISDLNKKIKLKEEELEQIREELSHREKIRQPYFMARQLVSTIIKGPMSKEASIERTQKIIDTIKLNGGVNVSVHTISKALGLTREAARAWMGRQIVKKQAAWNYGKDMSHYSLR